MGCCSSASRALGSYYCVVSIVFIRCRQHICLIFDCYQMYLCLLSNVSMLAIKCIYACYQMKFCLLSNEVFSSYIMTLQFACCCALHWFSISPNAGYFIRQFLTVRAISFPSLREHPLFLAVVCSFL